ncbi:hypothetical protein ACJIZ3_020786 [Penstemon smallii]|uniref:BHLH domain-containing protein n=1 Tax=Penstemon smallii TaxID=265156 RepID=A0ABD3SJT6_9LAMI
MHGLGGGQSQINHPTWNRSNSGDTLESLVNQAAAAHSYTFPADVQKEKSSSHMEQNSGRSPRGGKMSLAKKRVRSESEMKYNYAVEEKAMERNSSACASASAAFCRDRDTTMMSTWASFESTRSLKSTKNADEDHSLFDHDCSENQDEGRLAKGESVRSQSSARRSRAAAIHNQSERRRRDRINEKMKALQKLVPNASKTDKVSMLDEVIEHLKQLKAQVQIMNSLRNNMNMNMNMNMPQMVMQQQLQMSLLARMGMGMGMGMIGMNNLGRNVPQSLPPFGHLGGSAPSFMPMPFVMPQAVPPPPPLKSNSDATTSSLGDAYCTFLAQQSMNMDFYNKMAALYGQQTNQSSTKEPEPNDVIRGE